MSEFFDNEPDIITIEELNTINIDGHEEVKQMIIETDAEVKQMIIEENGEKADEEVKQMIIEGHVEKADEEVKQMIIEGHVEKADEEVKHIIKIKFKIEHILIGLLTTCGTLIVLISYYPMILIDLLICIIIIVLGGLYIVDKNLTMKILETCLLSIPMFISKSPIFLI